MPPGPVGSCPPCTCTSGAAGCAGCGRSVRDPRSGQLSGARDDARGHPAARGEIPLHLHEPRRAGRDELLEHLVHDLFLEDPPLAKPGEIVPQSPQLEQPLVGHVPDRQLAEVGAAGEGADGGELRRAELDEIVAAPEAVLDLLYHRGQGTCGHGCGAATPGVRRGLVSRSCRGFGRRYVVRTPTTSRTASALACSAASSSSESASSTIASTPSA